MSLATLTLPPRPPNLGVIIFGLECLTTRIVLSALLDAGVRIELICIPGRAGVPIHKASRRRSLPMAGGHTSNLSVARLAEEHQINLWRIGDLENPSVQEEIAAVSASLVVVACYNRLIPAAIYAERRFGGVNLHPSLLPDKRGPDPLFWVFYQDDRLAGSTVHRLTDRFDDGPILAQALTPKPDRISESALDAMLATLGAELLLAAIAEFEGPLPGWPASHSGKPSWAPHPTAANYRIERNWTARRAMNFVVGLAERGQRFTVDTTDGERVIDAVEGWTTSAVGKPKVADGLTAVEFSDGWLVCSLHALNE